MIGWMLLGLAGSALANTPDWVRQLGDRTEICSTPLGGDPLGRVDVPPLTPLQQARRAPREQPVGPLVPPPVSTLVAPDPMGLAAAAMPHPLRPGWSLVRVEVGSVPSQNALEQHITLAVDTSDSMSSASFRGVPLLLDEPPPEQGAYRTVNRLDLIREALHGLVDGFDDPEVSVAVVAFRKTHAVELLPPTPSTDHAALHAAVEAIRAENVGEEGEVFDTMYGTAAKAFSACADGRLLLLTDDRPAFPGRPEEVLVGVRAMGEQGLRLHTLAVATKADMEPLAQLTAAGGGELHRADSLAELGRALDDALRPVGSTVGEVVVEVAFDGPWRHDGTTGQGGRHRWDLPDPLPAGETFVEVYEVQGTATATLGATPYFGDTSRKTWEVAAAVEPLATASPVVRHAAAYVIAEAGIRVPAERAAAAEALREVVREVGPGREAQALLEGHTYR